MASTAEARDCVVIGGGPAGATTATLLAQQGVDVLLLERESRTRFHVGESLMPECYWVFERLGILDQLKNSSFPRKFSVQFVNEMGKESVPFYFFETNDHESAVTWQVWRADFDRLLLDNAQQCGVEVRDNSKVTKVRFAGDRATGVTLHSDRDAGGRRIDARVVVDASGQSSLIANRLGLRVADQQLKKCSVWTYFKGAQRDAGIDEGATLILSSKHKRSWFWYIPLPDDVTSVGVVGDISYLLADRKEPEQIFQQELDSCPAAAARVGGATQQGSYHVTKDFSYRSTRCAGEGWVLVGDAFGFLDPVYSTGILLALKSGEWAADAIAEGLREGDLSGAKLGCWSGEFLRGMDSLKRLVYAFYDTKFSFGSFIRQHPDQKKNLISLLIGDVFRDGVDEIFQYMDPMMTSAVPTAAGPAVAST